MKYALIQEGIIKNIIIADYSSANAIAISQECTAINVDNYPVSIGDTYDDEDNIFKTTTDIVDENNNVLIPAGTLISAKQTDEERLQELANANAALLAQVQEITEEKAIMEENIRLLCLAVDDLILLGGE
jgi:hypothetical protein